IPNNIHPDNPSVCLITKDPQSEYKELILGNKDFPYIKKVQGVGKLGKKFSSPQEKRQLCDEYDLFLADERILPMLPKILGKKFFETKKVPVAVNIKNLKNLKEELDNAFNCTLLHINTGTLISVKIGLSSHTQEQVLENILKSIDQILKKIPFGIENIHSIALKTSTSPSLPIWTSSFEPLSEVEQKIKLENELKEKKELERKLKKSEKKNQNKVTENSVEQVSIETKKEEVEVEATDSKKRKLPDAQEKEETESKKVKKVTVIQEKNATKQVINEEKKIQVKKVEEEKKKIGEKKNQTTTITENKEKSEIIVQKPKKKKSNKKNKSTYVFSYPVWPAKTNGLVPPSSQTTRTELREYSVAWGYGSWHSFHVVYPG
ncbi:hypothetical protein HK099_001702, partial [Clydaea vesicula]